MTLLILFTAQYLLFIILLIALISVLILRQKQQILLFKISLLAFPLSYSTAKILGHFIYNPRPFVVEHVQPLFTHAADNGFPSDHVLLSMAVASIFFTVNKKLGLIFSGLAIMIGLARILALVHHPADILGSVIIAISATYIAWFIIIKSKALNNYLDLVLNRLPILKKS